MQTFVKSHDNPEALTAERTGLQHLSAAIELAGAEIKIPAVLDHQPKKLTLSLIHQQAGNQEQFYNFGQALAQLHQVKQHQAGFTADNFIGLNRQCNELSNDWSAFFLTHRLGFQIKLIEDAKIQHWFAKVLDKLTPPLSQWLNQHCHQFSLLHGDLWAGNVLFDANDVWLIDPAVYCGDADTDTAMTELFGGFPTAFYQGYDSISPRSEAYPIKKLTYNLYHQLNHYNLFGNHYLPACQAGFQHLLRVFS